MASESSLRYDGDVRLRRRLAIWLFFAFTVTGFAGEVCSHAAENPRTGVYSSMRFNEEGVIYLALRSGSFGQATDSLWSSRAAKGLRLRRSSRARPLTMQI